MALFFPLNTKFIDKVRIELVDRRHCIALYNDKIMAVKDLTSLGDIHSCFTIKCSHFPAIQADHENMNI